MNCSICRMEKSSRVTRSYYGLFNRAGTRKFLKEWILRYHVGEKFTNAQLGIILKNIMSRDQATVGDVMCMIERFLIINHVSKINEKYDDSIDLSAVKIYCDYDYLSEHGKVMH